MAEPEMEFTGVMNGMASKVRFICGKGNWLYLT